MSQRESAPKQSSDVQPARKNITDICQLEQQALQTRSMAQSISDALTKAVGSIGSIILHAGFFLSWIAVNVGWIGFVPPFDPFPFGILTLIVSTEGVLLAIIILISQNRMIRQADRRAHLDLQINLLAEQEASLILRQVRRIAERLQLPPDERDREVDVLMEHTDVDKVMHILEEQLPKE
jgi:uncharacterized membrane protein